MEHLRHPKSIKRRIVIRQIELPPASEEVLFAIGLVGIDLVFEKAAALAGLHFGGEDGRWWVVS